MYNMLTETRGGYTKPLSGNQRRIPDHEKPGF